MYKENEIELGEFQRREKLTPDCGFFLIRFVSVKMKFVIIVATVLFYCFCHDAAVLSGSHFNILAYVVHTAACCLTADGKTMISTTGHSAINKGSRFSLPS